MKAHTSQFKEDIKTIGKQLDSKIIYELDGVVQTLTSEQLNSITPTFQGAILKSVMKELDIDSNIDIPIGTEVNYQFGLKTEGDFEYVNYGNYIVYSSEKQEDYDSYKIVCYDKMLYSMKKNEDLGITYPKTIRDYINTLCNKLGLEFKNKDDKFANFDRQIGKELYAGQDYTYRDIFDQLAEVTASTICLDENDKVEIRYINDLTDLYTVNGKEVTFESDIEYPMSFQVNGKSTQETTKGNQLIDFSNYENVYGNSTYKFENDTITLTTQSGKYNNVNWTITGIIKNNTGKMLYFNYDSLIRNGGAGTIVQLLITYTDGTIKYPALVNSNNIKYPYKIPDDVSDISSVVFAIYGNNSSTEQESNLIITKPMLQFGTDKLEYESYTGGQPSPNPDYPQEIVNVKGVENLFEPTLTINGISIYRFDGTFALDGDEFVATATGPDLYFGQVATKANNNYQNAYGVLIPVEPNTVYNCKINNRLFTKNYITEWNSDKKSLRYQSKNSNSSTFTTGSDTAYISLRFGYGNATKGDVYRVKVKIEKGSTIHDYVPYGSNFLQLKNTTDNESKTINIDLKGNELCSNKDKTVKDNLFVTKNGKVKIFKKIGKVVLTGGDDEHWSISTYAPNQDNTIYFNSNKYDNLFSNRNVLSNYFTYVQKLWDTDKEGIFYDTSNASSIRIRINKTIASTVSEFKTWLSTHNVEIQGELKEPKTIELDPVTPLKSYIGQNNISNNADADMNVTYSKNYETIDANFLKDINVNFGEKYGPVNSIVLSRSAESDNIYLQDEESITKNGLCEIKIKDNQIMNWNDRSDYLPDILEKLDGLEYYLNDFVSTGIAYLDLCDKYNVNVFENNYPCIMFNDELLVTQGLEENVHTDMPEETQTDYTKSDKTDRRINQAYIIVDKQQQEITSLTKQTNSIQDNLTNNYYTREQSNILIQNAQSGLTNTFSEAGGNNIFRNTGLWFSQSDANNPYEYWTGKNVSKQNTDKSSNGSLMMLKKGTLEQEQVVSNGNYTVSFKYKKLIQLATCKVIVNDNEYELTQMTDTEWQTGSKDADGNIVIKPLEVTSNHINVKFTSTVDNAIEIYDLMVNAGTVKLAYSQNENEVTTDTVNISKGITITSSANDTKFKANVDGIRILDKNNEKTILTEFTDKGMSTKEMEVENGATIVKVLVQNVENQTWFTRI